MTSHRKFSGDKLLIASNNKSKLEELKGFIPNRSISLFLAPEYDFPEPEETADSFIGNAYLKASYYAGKTGIISLADDSGLVVDALGGAPGIYSARWAGESRDFGLAMKRIEQEIAGEDNLGAHFVCALSLCWPDGYAENFEGRIYGKLTFPPKGGKGFGYDPIFIPSGYDVTFAEMDPALKHQISHRAKAFEQLVKIF